MSSPSRTFLQVTVRMYWISLKAASRLLGSHIRTVQEISSSLSLHKKVIKEFDSDPN